MGKNKKREAVKLRSARAGARLEGAQAGIARYAGIGVGEAVAAAHGVILHRADAAGVNLAGVNAIGGGSGAGHGGFGLALAGTAQQRPERY